MPVTKIKVQLVSVKVLDDSDWLAENMPSFLREQRPDVAVLHVGTEDLVASKSPDESLAPTVIENVDRMVVTLRKTNPGVKIILSKVLPVRGHADEAVLLNTKIEEYATSRSSRQSPVIVAGHPDGFDSRTDLSENGILPSATGAQKVAGSLATAITKAMDRDDD